MARNVWAMVEGKLQKRSLSAEDFYSLVRALMPILTKSEMKCGLLFHGLYGTHEIGTSLTENKPTLVTFLEGQ